MNAEQPSVVTFLNDNERQWRFVFVQTAHFIVLQLLQHVRTRVADSFELASEDLKQKTRSVL